MYAWYSLARVLMVYPEKYCRGGTGGVVETAVLTFFSFAFFTVSAVLFNRQNDSGKPRGKGRDRSRAKAAKRNKVVQAYNPYKAVAIMAGDNACESVKAAGDRRYLIGEAPSLPLPGCDPTVCTCKYRHLDDRRELNEDRRHPSVLVAEMYSTTTGEPNRRERKRGRRESDWA